MICIDIKKDEPGAALEQPKGEKNMGAFITKDGPAAPLEQPKGEKNIAVFQVLYKKLSSQPLPYEEL